MAAPRRAGVLARRGLGLTVSCDRGCKVLITGAVSTRRPARTLQLVAVARALPAARAAHVRLRIGPSVLRRLRKALGRNAEMIANVRVVAAGPTGKRATVRQTYVVQR